MPSIASSNSTMRLHAGSALPSQLGLGPNFSVTSPKPGKKGEIYSDPEVLETTN